MKSAWSQEPADTRAWSQVSVIPTRVPSGFYFPSREACRPALPLARGGRQGILEQAPPSSPRLWETKASPTTTPSLGKWEKGLLTGPSKS